MLLWLACAAHIGRPWADQVPEIRAIATEAAPTTTQAQIARALHCLAYRMQQVRRPSPKLFKVRAKPHQS